MADRELVVEIACRYLPSEVAARWLRLLRPAAALRCAGPGASVAAVLGGQPRLPAATEWPAWEGHGPLSYIGAIDCSVLRAVPLDIAVPQAGMLLFFYFDGQLDDGRTIVHPEEPETLAGARVLYLRPGLAASQRQCPVGLTLFERVELAAVPVVTFPGFEHPDLQAAFRLPGQDLRSFLDHPVNGEAFTQALAGAALARAIRSAGTQRRCRAQSKATLRWPRWAAGSPAMMSSWPSRPAGDCSPRSTATTTPG